MIEKIETLKLVEKLDYLITKINIIEEDINNIFEMQDAVTKILETLLKQGLVEEGLNDGE